MKNIYFMLLSAMLLVIVGCNKEKIDNGPVVSEETDDYVYIDLAMQLPAVTGTRSATDWDDENKPGTGDSNSDAEKDFEEGQNHENTVKTVLLALAGTDSTFISYAEISSGIGKTGESEYQIKAKFKRGDIDAAYAEGGALKKSDTVNVYAYANYSDYLHKRFSEITEDEKKGEWLNWYGTINERPSKAGSTPVITNNIWSKHAFLMTNAKKYVAVFPKSSDDWDAYADMKTPYDVAKHSGKTAIEVERCAARIDFMDASKDKDGKTNNCTYRIFGGLTSSGGDQKINLVDVQLTRMSLVNMSKSFYYLRRVATDYNDWETTGGRIGNYETKNNFVADTDWKLKHAIKGITPETAGDHFNFTLYGDAHVEDNEFLHYNYNRAGWYTDNISDIVGTVKTEVPEYHTWRYVTENTLPDVESQKTVQSTGIVFKGLILPGEHIEKHISDAADAPLYVSEAVKDALTASKFHLPKHGEGANESKNTKWDADSKLDNNSKNTLSYDYPVLYEFDGMLFAGSDEVVMYAANEGEGSLVYAAVQNVLNHWTLDGTTFKYNKNVLPADTKLTIRIYNEIRNKVAHVDDNSVDYTKGYTVELDESSTDFKALATSYNSADASNFTIYEASFEDTEQEKGEGWGYYCYYFYWNRHNDNSLNGKMGHMEFAIVRNNVYKLSVTTISRLGHPRNPDNDPDPFDPEDPDEDPRVYLTVDLKVLPWVVRYNSIEF